MLFIRDGAVLANSRTVAEAFDKNHQLVLERRVWEYERRTSNGRVIPPMSIYDLVHLHYPDGLGATFDIVENIIRDHPDVMALWEEVRKRPAGGANNPHGRKGKPEGEEIKLDNIQVDLPTAPTGTSAAAGLRKLQKAAAAGNDNARVALADGVCAVMAKTSGWRGSDRPQSSEIKAKNSVVGICPRLVRTAKPTRWSPCRPVSSP